MTQQVDWRDIVCSHLSQDDLTRVARVPGWSDFATDQLYRCPDLSKASQSQLKKFLDSVRASGRLRRRVKMLDLLLQPVKRDYRATILDVVRESTIRPEDACRYDGPLFDELYGMFKNLESLRIYGHSLRPELKTHIKLGRSLRELKIYYLGNSLTDETLKRLLAPFSRSLAVLHLEHPSPTKDEQRNAHWTPRSLRVGTIGQIVDDLPNLKSLTIGLAILNIRNDNTFLQKLFHLEFLEFIRVPKLRFGGLFEIPLGSAWKTLKVRDCPDLGASDLDIVLRRLPKLLHLDWRFKDDMYYEWEKNELKTASCRELKTLVLRNVCLGDQCLMRILRVMTNLETVALAHCEEIHRLRLCCARHYVLQDLPSFVANLHEAFDECFSDMHTLTVISQRYYEARDLSSAITRLFRDARSLQSVTLRACIIGQTSHDQDLFCNYVSRFVDVATTDAEIVLRRKPGTVGRPTSVRNRTR